jgi:SNF2 family DNA or RNA helicase
MSEVIFLESGWNPAQDHQVMCQAWCIGQTSKVLVTHLLLQGMIDSHIKEAIVQRNRLADEFNRALRDKAVDAQDC